MVGKDDSSQRFTVYTDVMTKRSEFFRAARDPKWLNDSTKPTDLGDEDPEIFSMYLNCVYFGIEATRTEFDRVEDHRGGHKQKYRVHPDAFDYPAGLHKVADDEQDASEYEDSKHFEQRTETLIKTHLLADKLQDPQTANLIIDELVHSSKAAGLHISTRLTRLVYASTVHPNPLRKLLRDTLVHETYSREYMLVHDSIYPMELARDVAVDFLRLKDANETEILQSVYGPSVKDAKRAEDKCRYHQHDEEHPRCVPKPNK